MNRIERYNKIASKKKNKSFEILELLRIKENDKVLEIGVGGGYYAKLFSDLIGSRGLYYGADTLIQFLENLKEVNRESSYNNIRPLEVRQDDIPRPDEKVNLIFTRNVYHHL